MTRVRKNLLANFIGSNVSGLVQIVALPLYLTTLGAGRFGLIGVFTTLQAILAFMDMGMSAALNRELAAFGQERKDNSIGDLGRTFEVVYLVLALVIGLIVALAAGAIASHWLNIGSLSQVEVRHALMLMGGAMAAQWPSMLYNGGLLGLQRHVRLNVIVSFCAVLRWPVGVFVLRYLGSDAELYFVWQLVVSLIQSFALAIAFRLALAEEGIRLGCVRASVAREPLQFAVRLSLISGLSIMVAQADKVVLSHALRLAEFGAYALAASGAALLYRAIYPIFSTFSPHLTRLSTNGDRRSLENGYHTAAQIMAIVIIPAAAVVVAFAPDLLWLWTGSRVVVAQAGLPLRFLTLGTMFHGLMFIPYALQLAYRWTMPSIILNIVAVLVGIPSMLLLAQHFGSLGPAAVWMVINLSALLSVGPYIHRRLLPGAGRVWLLHDFLLPLTLSFSVAFTFALLRMGFAPGTGTTIGFIVISALSTMAGSLLVMPRLRHSVLKSMKSFRVASGAAC